MSQPAFSTELFLHLGKSRLDTCRMDFLRHIDQLGTLVGAAKQCGISYKTACAWVDALNHAADEPLLSSAHGGNARGGTQLTPQGKLVLERWAHMWDLQSRIQTEVEDDASWGRFLARMRLRTSARNLLHGRIAEISGGNVLCLVKVAISGDFCVYARVGRRAVQEMLLEVGSPISVAIKASSIKIAHTFDTAVRHGEFFPELPDGFTHKAPNHWVGTVDTLEEDSDGMEARILLDSTHAMTALLSAESPEPIRLIPRMIVLLSVNPAHVVLLSME